MIGSDNIFNSKIQICMTKKKVVIVGGGTAGLTIASRLSKRYHVIVLEKSLKVKYPIIFAVPLLIGLLFKDPKQKYIGRRFIQTTSGRSIPFFESCVLGGASTINGCVHTIGSKILWESIFQPLGVKYKDVIAGYKTLFSSNYSEKNKINLTLAKQSNLDTAFFETLSSKNILIGDTNFSDLESCGRIYNTVGRFFRSSVLSLLKGDNIDIRSGQNVNHLLINSEGRVTGVATQVEEFYADFVILSGGVIGSCALLLSEIQNSNIPQNSSFRTAKVGRDIQDHTNLRVNVVANSLPNSLNLVSQNLLQKILLIMKHFFGAQTLMRGTGASSAVHLDLDGDGVVETRIQIVNFTESGRHGSEGKYLDEKPGFSLSITPINPKSKGRITGSEGILQINPNYLDDKEDIEILKKALKYCLMLLRSEPMKNFVKIIVDENCIENNPETYIRNNFYSGHHLIGGVQHAIDENFKVKGLSGLYVCDSSIFNGYVASNIHSTVVILAYIFSNRFINLDSGD